MFVSIIEILMHMIIIIIAIQVIQTLYQRTSLLLEWASSINRHTSLFAVRHINVSHFICVCFCSQNPHLKKSSCKPVDPFIRPVKYHFLSLIFLPQVGYDLQLCTAPNLKWVSPKALISLSFLWMSVLETGRNMETDRQAIEVGRKAQLEKAKDAFTSIW